MILYPIWRLLSCRNLCFSYYVFMWVSSSSLKNLFHSPYCSCNYFNLDTNNNSTYVSKSIFHIIDSFNLTIIYTIDSFNMVVVFSRMMENLSMISLVKSLSVLTWTILLRFSSFSFSKIWLIVITWLSTTRRGNLRSLMIFSTWFSISE